MWGGSVIEHISKTLKFKASLLWPLIEGSQPKVIRIKPLNEHTHIFTTLQYYLGWYLRPGSLGLKSIALWLLNWPHSPCGPRVWPLRVPLTPSFTRHLAIAYQPKVHWHANEYRGGCPPNYLLIVWCWHCVSTLYVHRCVVHWHVHTLLCCALTHACIAVL